MKQVIYRASVLCFIGFGALASAQVTTPYDGNVGINVENPEATLTVRSLQGRNNGTTRNLELNNGDGNNLMTVLNNGFVGLGTRQPSVKLHVEKGSVLVTEGNFTSRVDSNEGGRLYLDNPKKSTGKEVKTWAIFNMTNTATGAKYNPGLHFWAYAADGTNLNTQMIITDGGNVGIGSLYSNQESPDEKLTVDGKIKTTSLAGTGDRPVYADANGVLKVGTGGGGAATPEVGFTRNIRTDSRSTVVMDQNEDGTATVDYFVRMTGIANNITFTPASASNKGRTVCFYNEKSGTGTITPQPIGPVQTVQPSQVACFISDGTVWLNSNGY